MKTVAPAVSAPLLLLRDPVDFGVLSSEHNRLVNLVSGRSYPVVEGIPVFVDGAQLGPRNTKYQRMYDWMCHAYDLASTVGNWLTFGQLYAMRRHLAATANIKAGDCCLFTSIGTGADVPFLAERVPLDQLNLVGLDLSLGMLRRCQRRLGRMHAPALLVQANAERLPFRDHAFDSVVHVGGINFFDDPKTAVDEMVRVAKPGTLLLIADETPKVVKAAYRRIPIAGKEFADAPTDFDPPSWVPAHATHVRYEIIADGKCYLLTFRTPAP